MSLAHDLYRSEGNVARPLPKEHTEQRPARKVAVRKSYRGRVVAMGLAWVAVLGLVLLLVHRNTQALSEVSSMTQLKDELAAVERANAELEGQLDVANSVGKVEEWAKAHGMVRATKTKTVPGEAKAVASRPAEPAPAKEDGLVQDSIWAAFKSYLSRMSKAIQSAR